MKIAVFNCPLGITGDAVYRAFLDAGLPLSFLRKTFGGKKVDRETKNLILETSQKLKQARIFGQDAVDALTHVAAVAAALRHFGIQKCFLRRLAIGKKGNPHTLKLLRGFIVERLPLNRELVTPSGAAILTAFCDREDAIPTMRLEAVGEGTNQMRMSIGETLAPFRRERILLLETNIDDMNPQGFELLYERLFKAGALDVWVEPILMKKMRPAFKLSVLLEHSKRDPISETLFKETPTLGVRFLELDRFSLPRKVFRLKTRFGPVRMKMGWLDSRHSVMSPEYEDLKRIARKRNLSFREVSQWKSPSSKI